MLRQHFFRLIIALCVYPACVHAQRIPYPNYAGDNNQALRLALEAGVAPGIQLALQPFTFSDIATLVATLDTSTSQLSLRTLRDLKSIKLRLDYEKSGVLNEQPQEAKWLKRTFYLNKAYALSLKRPGLTLYVNPVLDIYGGAQSNTADGALVVQNTRGIAIRGSVDDKVWFTSNIFENQARLPSWEREWRSAYNNRVPGVGFYKNFNPLLWDAPNAVDYIQATGELGFNLSKHIGVRVGHGNPRLGNGYRSLFLDNFADPFLFAEIDTRVWKIHYRNLYTQLQDGVQTSTRISRKYMVAHTLGIQLTDAWEVGVTEQTVFARPNGFDLQYLNPVIFYRAVEQDNGSPDNAMIGAHSNLRLGKMGMLYGQFLLDELKVDELLGGNGWWANKYSLQVGGQFFNVFKVSGLDLMAEYNQIRPFTYAHRFPGINYSHYDQPLAHPWGASLREFHFSASYQPEKHWLISSKLTALQQADVAASQIPNLGANTLYNNTLRGRDFGYDLINGPQVNRTYANLQLSYLPFEGSSIFMRYDFYSRNTDDLNGLTQHGFVAGLTLNAVRRSSVF